MSSYSWFFQIYKTKFQSIQLPRETAYWENNMVALHNENPNRTIIVCDYQKNFMQMDVQTRLGKLIRLPIHVTMKKKMTINKKDGFTEVPYGPCSQLIFSSSPNTINFTVKGIRNNL